MVKRPFNQRSIARKQAIPEPFEGRAYKFYLLLPRFRNGAEIFEPGDALDLFTMLVEDFGGCSSIDEERSPVIGGWQMRDTAQLETTIDWHRSYAVYTRPVQPCKAYFRHLESNLRKHLLATKGIEEEQIMIEMTEIEIIKGKA